MRIFLSIDIDDTLKDKLLKLQGQLKGATLKKVKSFHLTLKFLGDVDEGKLPELVYVLDRVSFAPFSFGLDSCGTFPEKGKPRVIWAGVSPEAEIKALQAGIEDAMQGLGYPRDKRFACHITLCRVKHVDSPEELRGSIIEADRSMRKAEELGPVQVDSFRLKESTLTPEGPIYETIKTFKSKGPKPATDKSRSAGAG